MRRARCLLLLLPTLALAGCSRVDRLPTTPSSSLRPDHSASQLRVHGVPSYYPMAVGNRWRYAGAQTKLFILPNGDTLRKHSESKTEVVQVAMEQVHGRMYMREEIGVPDTVRIGGGVRWLREDRTALAHDGTIAQLRNRIRVATSQQFNARGTAMESPLGGVAGSAAGLLALRAIERFSLLGGNETPKAIATSCEEWWS